MTGFNHTLAGCLVAVVGPAPFAPLLAFLSHFLLDSFLHFGRSKRFSPYTRDFKMLLVVDAIACFASLGLALWLFPHVWWLLILCSFMATLPDFMWLLKGRVTWLDGFFRFATVIQWGERPWGWVLKLVYSGLFVSALFYLS